MIYQNHNLTIFSAVLHIEEWKSDNARIQKYWKTNTPTQKRIKDGYGVSIPDNVQVIIGNNSPYIFMLGHSTAVQAEREVTLRNVIKQGKNQYPLRIYNVTKVQSLVFKEQIARMTPGNLFRPVNSQFRYPRCPYPWHTHVHKPLPR